LDLADGEAMALLAEPLRNWHGELEHVLREWAPENQEDSPPLESFEIVLSGGVSLMPGLREHLNRLGSLRFVDWPETAPAAMSDRRFSVAYGTALHALGRSRQSASLLPEEVRLYWTRHHSLQVLHSLLLVLLVLLAVTLGLGTWQKLEWRKQKQGLQERTQEALDKAETARQLSDQARRQHEQLRPLLQRQRTTLDTLEVLSWLPRVRSNRSHWYVLLADRHSYFTVVPRPRGTNQVANTNAALPAMPVDRQGGFVVELCIPEKGEAKRNILSQIVAELNEAPAFSNVDSLPEDRRRQLVDPAVVIPEGHFALEIEVPEVTGEPSGTALDSRVTSDRLKEGDATPAAAAKPEGAPETP
jgi:hypothetical protein